MKETLADNGDVLEERLVNFFFPSLLSEPQPGLNPPLSSTLMKLRPRSLPLLID
jgi:hypothetical protein